MADRAAIAALVQKRLDELGAGCEAVQQKINERVAALYGLYLSAPHSRTYCQISK